MEKTSYTVVRCSVCNKDISQTIRIYDTKTDKVLCMHCNVKQP